MLIFNSSKELKEILNNLSFEKYYAMLPYVEKNFELAKDYIHFDDMVYETIMAEIKRRENVKQKILANFI